MTFHIKCLWLQNHCVLGSMKEMDLLKFGMQFVICEIY